MELNVLAWCRDILKLFSNIIVRRRIVMYKKILFVLFVFLLIAASSPVNAALVGYWPFAEGAGTTVVDGSGNGHDGTITGTPTWVDGPTGYGKALQFGTAGSTVVICGVWDTTTGGTNVSGTAWVKMSSTGGAQYEGIVANRNTNTDQSWALETYNTGNGFYFGAAGAGGGTHYGGTQIPIGTWAFLSFTFDGSTVRLYLNGAQVSTGTAALATIKLVHRSELVHLKVPVINLKVLLMK